MHMSDRSWGSVFFFVVVECYTLSHRRQWTPAIYTRAPSLNLEAKKNNNNNNKKCEYVLPKKKTNKQTNENKIFGFPLFPIRLTSILESKKKTKRMKTPRRPFSFLFFLFFFFLVSDRAESGGKLDDLSTPDPPISFLWFFFHLIYFWNHLFIFIFIFWSRQSSFSLPTPRPRPLPPPLRIPKKRGVPRWPHRPAKSLTFL